MSWCRDSKERIQKKKVLLYDKKLHIFLGKLRSKWIRSYVVKLVHPSKVITIINHRFGNDFKFNGMSLKEWF